MAALLESPNAKRKSTTVPWAELKSPRSKLLEEIVRDLECPQWGVNFGAVVRCRAEFVSTAEAKQNSLDGKLQRLLARDKSLPVTIAVQEVLKLWAASQPSFEYFSCF